MKLDIAGFAFIIAIVFLIVIFTGDPDLHDLYIEKVKAETGWTNESSKLDP